MCFQRHHTLRWWAVSCSGCLVEPAGNNCIWHRVSQRSLCSPPAPKTLPPTSNTKLYNVGKPVQTSDQASVSKLCLNQFYYLYDHPLQVRGRHLVKSIVLKGYHSISRSIDFSELCFSEHTFLILPYVRVDRVAREANSDICGAASTTCSNTGHAHIRAFSW